MSAIRLLRVLGLVGMTVLAACHRPTDYQRELANLERDIARLAGSEPSDWKQRLRLVFQTYRRAALTADYEHFAAAEQAIDAALARFGPLEDLLYLKASHDFKLHRNQRAAQLVAKIRAARDSQRLECLAGDLALQSGDCATAEKAYAGGEGEGEGWDVLARRAYLASRRGQVLEADRLYALAQEEVTAKEMRSFAWLELQRGILDLDGGRHQEALEHFRRANRAYSGYWLVEEHLAEALALCGHRDEAIAVYQRVVASTGHPEFLGALARLLAEREDPRAAGLAAAAEAGFAKQRARYPEAAVGHYLEYLLDHQAPSAELVPLAEENHRLRPNGDAKLLLARACLRSAQRERAVALLAEVRASGWATPEVDALARDLGGD